MDIWTECLEHRHLPLLECWTERTTGRLTASDFPMESGKLSQWFDRCSSDSTRIDCLISAYETPVGIAGLRRCIEQEIAAELYLVLGETNYNPLRTATYATLRMLDRAFLDCKYDRINAQICGGHREYLDALEQMGFSKTTDKDGLLWASVEKRIYIDRKYLF